MRDARYQAEPLDSPPLDALARRRRVAAMFRALAAELRRRDAEHALAATLARLGRAA